MIIILMRHGEAERQAPQDSERQLTEFGKGQVEQTANYILDKCTPDRFMVSPYDRAKQTLNVYTSQCPETPIEINESITPSDDAMVALNTIANLQGDCDCILIVCHMPIVANLAALLLGNNPEFFALAEARVIETDFIAADLGHEVDRFVPTQP